MSINNSIREIDFKMMHSGFPKNLISSQSLKAWGYRLTNQKGDYEGPWDLYSEAMMDYCEQDVKVTYELWRKISSRL